MKAKNFDKIFDEGKEDITPYLDLNTVERVNQEQESIRINIPEWMLVKLGEEAKRIGVSRQDIIKIWLSERLERIK